MHIFIAMTNLLIAIFSYRIYKNILNPVLIFNVWWGSGIFLSGFGMFETYIPSDKTYIIMLIVIVVFSLISILFKLINLNFEKKEKKEKKEIIFFNNNFVNILSVGVFIILLKRSLEVYNLSSSQYFYENIRYNFYYTNLILKNNVEVLINNFFVEPILWVNIIYLPISIFTLKKHRLIKVIMILNILLYSYSSGARTFIFYSMISTIIIYFIMNKEKKIKWSKKLLIIFSVVFFIIIGSYIGLARSLGDENIFNSISETIITYFTNSYYFFDVKINNTDFNQNIFYGTAMFGGIIDFLKLIIKNLFDLNINTAAQIIGGNSQIYEVVGIYKTYNAFPTMIYTFMFDWGYFGILIGTTIFSIGSSIIFEYYTYKKNILSISMYTLLILIIFESTLRWTLIFIWPYIVFIIFIYMHKYNKRKNRRLYGFN